ncbi:MAG: hypothetical protein AAFV74_19940 [Pseudomonadota bacterium]
MSIKRRLKKLENKDAKESAPCFFTIHWEEEDGSVDPSKSLHLTISQGKQVSPEPGETEEEFRSRIE